MKAESARDKNCARCSIRRVDAINTHPINLPFVPQRHILKNLNTGPLVKDKACEFMCVRGAARMTDGVRADVNRLLIR